MMSVARMMRSRILTAYNGRFVIHLSLSQFQTSFVSEDIVITKDDPVSAASRTRSGQRTQENDN
jgi:hypothetical protein